MYMHWLAFDIGGANLKCADGIGFAASTPFELWKQHRQLAEQLRKLVAASPPCDRIAVTMTGELADCFNSKTEGVQYILDQVVQAVDGRPAWVYLSDGRMVSPAMARRKPLLAAASNWHALACYSGRLAPRGTGLIIDIGSTTCDVIPLRDGQPFGVGCSDTERLLTGQLVYTGVERSPICAVVQAVPYRGHLCPVAQEFFATTHDAYLILGHVQENPGSTATADGRPATRTAARARLGRMLCADENDFDPQDAEAMAQAVCHAQIRSIASAVARLLETLPSQVTKIIVSGQGEFLASRVIRSMKLAATVISLNSRLGAVASRCAAAHALACLAREAAS